MQTHDMSVQHDSVLAFVQFENDEGKDFALALFKRWRRMNCRQIGETNLFRNAVKLSVKRAPEPDDIIFQNLESSKQSKFCGRLASVLLVSIVLLIALAINAFLRLEKEKLAPSDTSDCPQDDTMTMDWAKISDANKNCFCAANVLKEISFCDMQVSNRGER